MGLAFIFACALDRRSPLYLLDECDAALDENNQQAVAASLQRIFGGDTRGSGSGVSGLSTAYRRPSARAQQQVLAVSHQASFSTSGCNLLLALTSRRCLPTRRRSRTCRTWAARAAAQAERELT